MTRFTRAQVREITALQRELGYVPEYITRREAFLLCDRYALDAPIYSKGSTSTAFRKIDVIAYMVRHGVCPTRTSKIGSIRIEA
jgi:hypothetical protein